MVFTQEKHQKPSSNSLAVTQLDEDEKELVKGGLI